MNLEQEAQSRLTEKDKDRNVTGIAIPSPENSNINDFILISKREEIISNSYSFRCADVQTLDTMQALCLPLGASVSLLVMFFFFDSMQLLFAVCTASKLSRFFSLLTQNLRP